MEERGPDGTSALNTLTWEEVIDKQPLHLGGCKEPYFSGKRNPMSYLTWYELEDRNRAPSCLLVVGMVLDASQHVMAAHDVLLSRSDGGSIPHRQL